MSPSRSKLLCCASVLFFAVSACSQETETPANTDLTATLPQDGGKSEMTEQGRLNAQQRDSFLAACRQNALPSQAGEDAASEDCEKTLERAQKSAEAAQILTGAYFANGAASATSLNDIRTRLPRINWTEEQTGGSTIASGKLGDFDTAITQRNRRQHLSFNWNGPAGSVPVDIADALSLSGAKLDLVACYASGSDETGRAWRVKPVNSDAFDLTTFTRIGPSGTAISSYTASVPLDRNVATLETLRAEDSDWSVCG